MGIIDQTRGRGSHSLIWPSRLCVAEQGIPVFKDSSLKQGIQYHDLASQTGCLFGPDALKKGLMYDNEQSKRVGTNNTFLKKYYPMILV